MADARRVGSVEGPELAGNLSAIGRVRHGIVHGELEAVAHVTPQGQDQAVVPGIDVAESGGIDARGVERFGDRRIASVKTNARRVDRSVSKRLPHHITAN